MITARAFLRRFDRVLRYGLVGAGVTLFYTLVTVGLLKGHVVRDPTLATAMASILTLPVSFLAHRRITYADVANHKTQWTRFIVLSGMNFVISTGSMKVVDLCGAPYWVGLIIGFILVPLANYTVSTLWVFKTTKFFALED